MKKKILIINTANTGFTGITSVIMNYVRKTYKNINYDFVLCGRVEEKFKNELETLGTNVFIPPCSRVKNPLGYSSWLKKLMKKNKYDVLHVHGNSGTMYFEINAAKQSKIPVRIAHSHSTSCKYMLAHKILKPLLNRELTDAIACSDLAGKWLFTRDYTVLQNGIDVDKFTFSHTVRDEYRKKLGLEDKFVVGHIGYMDTEKNHMFLLRVFKQLVEKRPDARLLLIGDGRLRSEIEQYIAENGLTDFVQVLGKRTDVANLYQCMDVFVLPSLFEGLPVTLVEAQAAGLPCLLSDIITKQVDITKRLQYISVEEADVYRWVNAMLTLSETGKNRTLYVDVLKRSEFNIENCVRNLLHIYKIPE